MSSCILEVKDNATHYYDYNSSDGILGVEVGNVRVHGLCELTKAYKLIYLPPKAIVKSDQEDSNIQTELTQSHNLPKILIAIGQALYASATLYRARGDQFRRYGYAAFALTVIPYLIMSILNLCSNVFVADYPCLYIARSYELDEALCNGAKIDGCVGRLHQSPLHDDRHDEKRLAFHRDGEGVDFISYAKPRDSTDAESATVNDGVPHASHSQEVSNTMRSQPMKDSPVTVVVPSIREYRTRQSRKFHGFVPNLIFLVLPLPYAIIAGLTHFEKGQSTHAQRVWTMTWLTFGVLFGVAYGTQSRQRAFRQDGRFQDWWNWIDNYIYSAPAIGGFVVVGQMLKEYGYCTLLS